MTGQQFSTQEAGSQMVQTKKQPPNQTDTARRSKRFRWLTSTYTWYLVPPVVILLFINVVPLLYTIYLSFHQWVLYRQKTPEFIGLENWVTMLTSERFWHSLWVEFLFVAGAVFLEFVLGFAIALFLNREMRARDLVRSLYLFPMVLPPIVAAFLWRFMLQADIGVINYVLRFVGLDRAWLASSATALPTLIVVDVWQFTPFVILLLLAGLENRPGRSILAAVGQQYPSHAQRRQTRASHLSGCNRAGARLLRHRSAL